MQLSKVHVVVICVAVMVSVTAIFAILGWWQAAVIGLAAMQAASLLLVVKSYARAPTRTNIRDLRTLVTEVDRRVDAAASRALTETLTLGEAVEGSAESARASVEQLSDSLAKERQRTLQEISALLQATDKGISDLKRSLTWRNSQQLSQVDALFQLYGHDVPAAPMPLTGGWAIDPSSMVVLLDLIEQRRPELVLEFGSGTSTVWIALALEQLGKGRLVSIEHDEAYASETQAALDRHDIGHRVDLRVAALRPSGIDGHETSWYDQATLADIETVDMLLVDGPPQQTGAMARYPALPVLFDHLSTGGLVVVDDGKRSDESAMIERWTDTYPGLTELTTVPRSAMRVLRLS